jgi:hypothetical protein
MVFSKECIMVAITHEMKLAASAVGAPLHVSRIRILFYRCINFIVFAVRVYNFFLIKTKHAYLGHK